MPSRSSCFTLGTSLASATAVIALILPSSLVAFCLNSAASGFTDASARASRSRVSTSAASSAPATAAAAAVVNPPAALSMVRSPMASVEVVSPASLSRSTLMRFCFTFSFAFALVLLSLPGVAVPVMAGPLLKESPSNLAVNDGGRKLATPSAAFRVRVPGASLLVDSRARYATSAAALRASGRALAASLGTVLSSFFDSFLRYCALMRASSSSLNLKDSRRLAVGNGLTPAFISSRPSCNVRLFLLLGSTTDSANSAIGSARSAAAASTRRESRMVRWRMYSTVATNRAASRLARSSI
mmetsp:Transcript_59255/g.163621  ORF Transcript_59255/g.163621 Transcript_59255/m.163621 type:complete len:299 (-) Transcript_59255:443-1339(-)